MKIHRTSYSCTRYIHPRLLREARTLKDIRLTYRAVGSSTGQREFTQTEDNSAVWTAGLTDFGAGDIPMSSSVLENTALNWLFAW